MIATHPTQALEASAPAGTRRNTTDRGLLEGDIRLPEGTPAWITPELVALTHKVWQPRSSVPLSVEDSITILRNTDELFDVLARR